MFDLVVNEIAFSGDLGLSSQLVTKNDIINQQILRELTANGRISNLELAERIGLSPSACLRRVQELERQGVIRGYRAVLDPQAMGVGFVTYIGVGLNEHSKAAQEAFERAMQIAPEVVECHNITGTIEYLMRVECADLPSYKRFHTDVLGTAPHVNAITSYVVMGSPKDQRS
jgi:DNA-binding Lrp family transcriptional regulator